MCTRRRSFVGFSYPTKTIYIAANFASLSLGLGAEPFRVHQTHSDAFPVEIHSVSASEKKEDFILNPTVSSVEDKGFSSRFELEAIEMKI